MRRVFFEAGLRLLAVIGMLTAWGGIPVAHAAASLYFSPSSIKANVGATTTVTLFVSSPDQAMNSAGGTIVLPESYVTPVSVSKSGSILSTWPEEPTISGATIRFSGGLPTPGYTGGSGKILSFTIRGKAEGTGLITINSGKILANDGKGTNIIASSGTATVTVSRTISGATISSPTHPDPDKWYNKRDAELTWTKPAGVSSFSYSLTHDGGAAGTSQSSTTAQSASFTNLAEGVWTFSLTAKYSDGKTADSSYTLRIDVTPPNPFSVKVTQTGLNDAFPTLTYSTTDVPSGIDYYLIFVDLEEVGKTTETTFKLPRQRPGTHKITVKAVDKAGNVTEATATFSIEGFAGPVITSYPRFVSVLQPITLKGKAYYGARLVLFIDGKQAVELVVKDILTIRQRQALGSGTVADDQEVEWTYAYDGLLLPGKHHFFATQIKTDGAESNPSNTVTVRVLAGSVNLGGVIIPMLFVVIVLLLLLAIVGVVLYLIYRKLKGLIGSWRRRLAGLQEQIDKDIVQLEGAVKDDVQASEYEKVESEIEKTKEEIDKEFKDELNPSGESSSDEEDTGKVK